MGLMAREITGSGTNIEVCKQLNLSDLVILIKAVHLAHHRICRGAVGKGISGRTLDTKDRTDLAGTNLVDIL
jgi:hypothetical protein